MVSKSRKEPLPGVDREHEGITKEFHFSSFARIILVVLRAEAVGLLNGARFTSC